MFAVGVLFTQNLKTAAAQDDLFLKNQIGDFGDVPPAEDPVTMSADFKIKTGSRMGMLNVRAEIDPKWHVFAMKKTKGPIPSQVSIAESNDFKVIGGFKADREPHAVKEEGFDEPCLEFEGSVTWSAAIELAENVDPKDLTIDLVFNGQTCESKPFGSCRQLTFDLEAEFDGFDDALEVAAAFKQAPVTLKEFQPEKFNATVKARIVRAAGTDDPIKSGDYVKLEMTIKPLGKYHVYSYSLKKTDYMSTIVGFTETNGWKIKGPEASKEPEEGEAFGVPAFYYHEPVMLTFFFNIPETAENNKTFTIKGTVGMQVCTESACDPPTGAAFEVAIPLGSASIVPVNFASSTYSAAQDAIKAGGVAEPASAAEKAALKVLQSDQESNQEASQEPEKEETLVVVKDSPKEIAEMAKLYDAEKKISYLTYSDMDANPVGSGGTSSALQTTFWTAMFGAFVGGMILNLMPCVFPVLGLKVMGFVKQAGSDPKKIRMHGLAFTGGLVVSMWILAGIILTVKLSFGQDVNWGAQMGNPYFVCGIIVLLFLLGLNMAGVFEIGTSMSSVGGNIKAKNG